jgi:hypothetical protein
MAGKGRPSNWTQGQVTLLQACAQYGYTMPYTAKLLSMTVPAVGMKAHRLGIKFHGKAGAPQGNINRRLYLLRQEIEDTLARDQAKYGLVG